MTPRRRCCWSRRDEALAEARAAELARQLRRLAPFRRRASVARFGRRASSWCRTWTPRPRSRTPTRPSICRSRSRTPDALLPLIRNAGAVFAGPLAAETFGDYLAGSSHVLPTDGAARAWGGVSVHTFIKAMTVQTVTPEAARRIAGPAAMLARLEALEGHARAADARLERGGMSDLAKRLARPEILALEPFDIAAQFNWAYGPTRSSSTPTRTLIRRSIDGALAASVNRYPEPQPGRLHAAMAALYGVEPDNLVVTRGADDAIDILVRAFCRPGEDAVAICRPTFSAYAHFVRLQGARLIEVPLDPDFDFHADAFIEAVKAEPSLKLAFICTPNNPTGNEVDPAEILRVADALPETIIVADEAYLEFSIHAEPRGRSRRSGRTSSC